MNRYMFVLSLIVLLPFISAANCGGPGTTCADAGQTWQSDPYNCGACGVNCQLSQTCVAGRCTDCPVAGQAECNNVCTNIATNPKNCGGCTFDCSASGLNGCCAGVCKDFNTDQANCGACNKPCPAHDVCFNGKCIKGSK